MAEIVEGALMEAAERAKGVDFGADELAYKRLGILTRLKGGGIRSLRDLRQQASLGAILDMLPRCIDNKDDEGGTIKDIYTRHLGDIIGEGAFEAT